MPEGLPSKLDARLDVVGTRGQVSVEVRGDGLLIAGESSANRPDIVYGPTIAGQQAGALRAELEHFAHCLLTGAPPLISPADARAAVEVAVAIHESLATGAPVILRSS
jgi:myo-inositol 2-dehydrogenase/D-chiro-inositol 1-dehydrogenase